MRVLFVSAMGIGHVFPMVPLAWAFRAAGHEVLLATTGEAVAAADAGLPVVDVAGASRAGLVAQLRAAQPGGVEHLLATRIRDLSELADQILGVAPILVDGAIRLAREWRPDLVVQSQAQGAGLVIAGALGIPVVEHNFGLVRATGMHERYWTAWGEVFERHAVPALPERRVWLDVAPPTMCPGEPVGWPMRYVPYNGGAQLPAWLREPPSRPRVAVTLGTVAPGMTGIGEVERVVAAAAELDAEFVLALGAVDLGPLGDLPENVRAAGWVPLNALLPSCAALVHHGGAGATMTALEAGVPQLVLPNGADRYLNADAVAGRGVGISSSLDELDAALIGELLAGDTFRRAAAEVRAEIRARPAPSTVVDRMVELAGDS